MDYFEYVVKEHVSVGICTVCKICIYIPVLFVCMLALACSALFILKYIFTLCLGSYLFTLALHSLPVL